MDNNLVQIWLYDTTNENKLIGEAFVSKDTELTIGQTSVKPKDGLYGTPRFDEEGQDWFGMSREEWLKTHPFHDSGQLNQPSQQQELMATLMKQNAALSMKLQSQVKVQATVNATLMKSMAELKANAQQEA